MAQISGVYGYGTYGAAIYGVASWTTSESVSFSDSVVAYRSLPRAVAETVSFSDSVVSHFGAGRSASEAVSFSDSVSVVRQFVRAVVETVTFSDAVIRKYYKPEDTRIFINSYDAPPSVHVISAGPQIIKSTAFINGSIRLT